MGTYEKYRTDDSLEKDGILLDLGESGCFVVARAGGANRKYQELVRKLTQKHRRQILAGTLDASVADRITIEAFSKTIVLGWLQKGDRRGDFVCEHDVTGPDGLPLPFNPQNAARIMTDLPDLFADIKECAENAAGYRAEVVASEGEPSLGL